MQLPERSRKFFSEGRFYSNGIKEYQNACTALGSFLEFDAEEMAAALTGHMDEVIEQQDIAIGMIATGGSRRHSRNEAIVETFAWRIAFTEEGKQFGRERGFNGSMLEFVTWIGEHYPLPFKSDPIRGWQARADRVRSEKNPHRALKKYRDFMTQTADVRATFDDAHGQVEEYIDQQIERMRGN